MEQDYKKIVQQIVSKRCLSRIGRYTYKPQCDLMQLVRQLGSEMCGGNFEIDGEYMSYSQPFVLSLGVTDGIAEMEQVVKTPDSVYDLSGRKLVKGKYGNNRLSKGVYIENGNKKVLK